METKDKAAKEPKPELDTYMAGNCGRCQRPRTECQKIVDSGRRCTEKE